MPDGTSASDEEAPFAGGSRRVSRSLGVLEKWCLGDWAVTVAISFAGFQLDQALPFERPVQPQLQDSAIAYPHKKQAFPAYRLWQYAFFLPLLVIVATALLAPAAKAKPNVGRALVANEAALGLASTIAATLLLVCFIKNAIGRLRPDFLARCQFDGTACTGDARVVREGRKSFPSGHTAISFAGLGYLSLYLAARLQAVRSHPAAGELWKLPVVVAPWLLALHIALSRISDFWHHWEVRRRAYKGRGRHAAL